MYWRTTVRCYSTESYSTVARKVPLSTARNSRYQVCTVHRKVEAGVPNIYNKESDVPNLLPNYAWCTIVPTVGCNYQILRWPVMVFQSLVDVLAMLFTYIWSNDGQVGSPREVLRSSLCHEHSVLRQLDPAFMLAVIVLLGV